MELLDVVDENNNLIGIKEDKNIIHKKGLLHREIAVIIQNENGEYLVQKRSSNKKGAPNMWSFTTGHVELGEDYETTAIREIKEEDKNYIFSEKAIMKDILELLKNINNKVEFL